MCHAIWNVYTCGHAYFEGDDPCDAAICAHPFDPHRVTGCANPWWGKRLKLLTQPQGQICGNCRFILTDERSALFHRHSMYAPMEHNERSRLEDRVRVWTPKGLMRMEPRMHLPPGPEIYRQLWTQQQYQQQLQQRPAQQQQQQPQPQPQQQKQQKREQEEQTMNRPQEAEKARQEH